MAGCTVAREPSTRVLALPQSWSAPSATASAPKATARWWATFGSAELARFIRVAQAQNFGLAAADARIRQAQALAVAAGAAQWPQIGARVGSSHGRHGSRSSTAQQSLGIEASFDIDLWGAVAARRDAAIADAAGAAYARDAVALELAANVAATYLQAVSARERTGFAQQALQTAERILHLVAVRVRAGAAAPLDLAQQRGLVASQRQALSAVRETAQNSMSALAILLGRAPQGMWLSADTLEGITATDISPGVPTDILTHRPDIAEAEQRLAAADANVAAARAAMLPALTLTAQAGGDASAWGAILERPFHELTAGLLAPIFNAGRLKAGRVQAQAQRDALLAAYRGAILTALNEVETSLTIVREADLRHAAQTEVLNQAQTALRLAEARYRMGGETLLTVLDAQRTLYAAQDASVQLTVARLLARVELFKALGGGWHGKVSKG